MSNSSTLNQPQREALINILVVGMYADGHLSIAEDDQLNAFLDAIEWESGTGRTVFLTDAINRVNAFGSDEALASYVDQQAVPFESFEAKQFASDQLGKFLKSDGISKDEAPLFARFRRALGL